MESQPLELLNQPAPEFALPDVNGLKQKLSYLIQTPAFDELPEELKSSIGQRIKTILNAETPEQGFEHLTAEDRTALMSILAETKPGLFH